jgi:nucleoside-diphosphate-sugar epimerase
VDPAERDGELAKSINASLPETLAAHVPVAAPGWQGRALIHAGSGIEYGSAPGVIDERTTPVPVSAYARSKLAGTNALSEAARRRAPGRFLTVRLFAVYGPGEHEGRLLPSLIDAAEKRAPLSLTAGTQRRDFTFVRDVAEGLVRLAVAPESPYDVVNLATGHSTTVREFVRTAAAVLPLAQDLLRFGELPTRPDEMKAARVDVTRIRSMTGWLPGTGIEAGIIQTRDFCRRLASDGHNHIV